MIASWGSSSGATVDENRKNQFKSQLLQIFFVLVNGSLSLGVCARLLGAALPDRAVQYKLYIYTPPLYVSLCVCSGGIFSFHYHLVARHRVVFNYFSHV